MIELTPSKDLCFLVIETITGGKPMKGKVQHLSGICSKCRKGDKNILFHKCNRICIYLDYLDQPKQFISSKDKGTPFENNRKNTNISTKRG
jgi:pyruvate formate-lyase activating enzyme-like uncharacterized protein